MDLAKSASGDLQRDLAVRSVFWRKGLDWVVANIPPMFHPALIGFWTLFFFIFAGPARKAVLHHLRIIFPDGSIGTNFLRAFRVFHNFAWTLTDSAAHRLRGVRVAYELEGENFLNELVASERAILLTAHMGNYDLGAALFAEKFSREIRMVRAPEPDPSAAKHVDLALAQSSSGGIKVDYSTAGASVSFDLLAALREGKIISIQGDRIIGDVARAPVNLFGREVLLPTGPFVLSLVSETKIFPLFVVRKGFRSYKIIAREPIECRKGERPREEEIAIAMNKWARVLEEMIATYWQQWFAFVPIL